MTRAETLEILSSVKVAYPNFYRNSSPEDTSAATNLWAKMFEDEPYELVSAAVRSYIASDTKGFPPPIGALKETIRKWRDPYELGAAGKYGVTLSSFGRTARERMQLEQELERRALQGENIRLPEASGEMRVK